MHAFIRAISRYRQPYRKSYPSTGPYSQVIQMPIASPTPKGTGWAPPTGLPRSAIKLT